MTISKMIAFYETCFDDLAKELERYDFHPDYHPQIISLLLAINDRLDRLRVIQKHQKNRCVKNLTCNAS